MATRPVAGPTSNSAPASHADAVQIREALREVLESVPFRTSRQCQSLLTYVVEHTLAGENDLLRERVIGTEVFGRVPAYEPGEDPVVRVRAAEVRKRLAQYYQNRADHVVQIDIPPGSYRAVFHWKAVEPTPLETRKLGLARSLWPWLALALLATAASALVVRGLLSSQPSALDQFWAPALVSPKPILIYSATTTIFHSPDLTDTAHDLVAVRGQYMTTGDAYAGVALGSLFSGKGKLFQVRYGSDLTFGDLRYQPSILIGAFGNAWTLQLTNNLRFVFDKHPTIRDRFTNRIYTLPDMTPDGRTPEDYAIVSRVFDSNTGELLIAAAGITQYGSRAAAEFLTSSRLMATLAANAPRDWRKKNLQVLLHTRVVDNTAGPPRIVTTYFW